MSAQRTPRRAIGLVPLSLLAAAALLISACNDQSVDEEALAAVAHAETVQIQTEDGLRLDARLFEASPDAVAILTHMYPSDQTAWFTTARELQQRGISVLTLNFRGYGESEGEKDASTLDRDIRSAIDFARARGYQRIALVGASMGGTASIVVAAREPVDGVFALSAPLEFQSLDAAAAISSVTAPLMLVAAEDDISAAYSLDTMAKRAELRDERWLILEGTAHGTDLLKSEQADLVRARLFAFLDEVLLDEVRRHQPPGEA